MQQTIMVHQKRPTTLAAGEDEKKGTSLRKK